MTHAQSFKSLALIATTLCYATAAQALSVSFSDSFSIARSVNSSANTTGSFTDNLNGTDYISLSRFDASLGTLDYFTLSFSDMEQYSTANANFKDDDWLNETAGYQRLQNLSLTTNVLGYTYYDDRTNRISTCSDTGGVTSGASCNTSLSGSTSYFHNQSTNVYNPGALATVTGPGSFTSTVYQYGGLYTTETDGDDGYVNSRYGYISSSGTVEITYHYSAYVPVPAAAWLFGSSLLALVGVRRRHG